MLGLGGKTLVAIVYTARDPIPESIEFYHISEDSNDLGHNEAPRLGIVGNVKATMEALAAELELKISPDSVERNVRIAQEVKEARQLALKQQADAAGTGPQIRPIVAVQEVMRAMANSSPTGG